MPSNRLLWIGFTGESARPARQGLETELGDVIIDEVSVGPEALAVLAKAPDRHLIVIIELQFAAMDMAALVTGIKQINPAIEIIVLGHPGPNWGSLPLPRYYRPIFLDPRCDEETLISCVAKLREMVEAREGYDQLSRGIGENIGISRTSTEAILALLNRQAGMGVIGMRRDGFFSSYNSEAQRLTGYDLGEVAHIQVWAQALLVDYESVRALLEAIESFWAKKTGRENMRLRIRHKDGRIVTLSLTMLVLLDNFGQARQIVALFFDPLESAVAEEYHVLAHSSASAFYTYLPETGFLRMSAGALDLINKAFSLHLGMDDVLNRKISELPMPHEPAHQWEKRLERVATGQAISNEGFSPMGLAGRRIMDHALVARVRTGTKEAFAVFASLVSREDLLSSSLRDLSASALAEKTLECIPRPFTLLRSIRDEDGRIQDFLCVMINQAAKKLLGVGPPCGAGISFSEAFPDTEGSKTIFESAREVSETGGSRSFEISVLLRPDATNQATVGFWLGKVGDGAAVFFRDVTALREEERHLKQYRHVFSHMQEAIIVTDLEGNIIDWNPASEKMFGYSKSEIWGRSAYILTQNKGGDQLEQQSRSVLREGDVWKGEYEFIRHDGSQGVAFSVFALLKDDQGNAYGTVGLCHDLTERKRLEERLTAKSQELQEKNLALNTLLRYAEEERVRACEQVVAELARKINERLFHILGGKDTPQVVETHAKLLLQELGVSGQTKQLNREDPALSLSEKELEVAQLIRLGKTTEEIAFILDKSPDTIRLQRISIRKKLGLTRRDRNLAGYLRKMDLL